MEKDYYKILGLTEDDKKLPFSEFAPKLKKVYKKLCLKWHPDKFSNASEEEQKNAEQMFKDINEANSILSDENKKREYDQFGTVGQHGFGGNPFGDFNPFDFFGGMGGHRRIVKGENIQVNVNITLDEAFNGGIKEIKYNKLTKCVHCNGTGSADGVIKKCQSCGGTGMYKNIKRTPMGVVQQITTCPQCNGNGQEIEHKCEHCNGTGLETIEVTQKINIPKGNIDKNYIVINGQGNECSDKDGINGDLIIIFNLLKNDIFDYDGDDLDMELKLNISEAWLGCKKEIKCPDGTMVNIGIPELSEYGKILRLKGKGFPKKQNINQNGDLYITIVYEMPKKLNDKQKQLIKDFYNE